MFHTDHYEQVLGVSHGDGQRMHGCNGTGNVRLLLVSACGEGLREDLVAVHDVLKALNLREQASEVVTVFIREAIA